MGGRVLTLPVAREGAREDDLALLSGTAVAC